MNYSRTLVTAPTSYPVSLTDVKHELRLDHDYDDAMLSRYIATATELVEHEIEAQLVSQTWDYSFDVFPPGREGIPIFAYPVTSITSVTYTDEDGNGQTWSSANYETDLDRRPALVRPKENIDYPETDDVVNAVVVRVVSGYSTLPEPVKLAIRSLIIQWYDNRESVGEITPGAMRLLDSARWVIRV